MKKITSAIFRFESIDGASQVLYSKNVSTLREDLCESHDVKDSKAFQALKNGCRYLRWNFWRKKGLFLIIKAGKLCIHW